MIERIKNIRAKFAAVTPDVQYISTVWGLDTNGISDRKGEEQTMKTGRWYHSFVSHLSLLLLPVLRRR